jgi:hypothetical protein
MRLPPGKWQCSLLAHKSAMAALRDATAVACNWVRIVQFVSRPNKGAFAAFYTNTVWAVVTPRWVHISSAVLIFMGVHSARILDVNFLYNLLYFNEKHTTNETQTLGGIAGFK